MTNIYFFFLPITPKQSYLTIISEDSSMVEESLGSFQLYRDWEIPCETTATGRELPIIHTYRVIVSPAGLEPTRQRCVASRETNLTLRLTWFHEEIRKKKILIWAQLFKTKDVVS